MKPNRYVRSIDNAEAYYYGFTDESRDNLPSAYRESVILLELTWDGASDETVLPYVGVRYIDPNTNWVYYTLSKQPRLSIEKLFYLRPRGWRVKIHFDPINT